MNILCTICARKGSKGVKNKNIITINNKHLIYYTISIAKKSKIFEDIVFSTDSKKFQKIAKKYGLNSFFLRPKKLSTSTIPKIPVIRHALIKSEKYYNKKYDYIIDLDVSSPLRTISDIKKAFNKIIKTKSDSLFSVNNSRKNPYYNVVESKKNNIFKLIKNFKHSINSRQIAPKVYDMNASIHIWKRKALLKNDTLFRKKNTIYLMPDNRGHDIDSKNDLKIVSYFLKNKKLYN